MLLTDSRAPSPPAVAGLRRASILKPSPADFVLASILVWAFVAGRGWLSLLADGDTGWHIRTGDWILRMGRVPTHDLFSFSKEGQPWFAWEWLSDICLAILHRNWGMPGVVIFSGVVLSVSILLLFRWMLWRNAGFFGALAISFLATGAASVHFLARPHIFTFLLLIVSLWTLDRDRRSATRWVWMLVPVCVLWTNLHGGFLALIACLAMLTAASLAQAVFQPASTGRRFARRYARVRRYGILTAACGCATLINPFGYHLHQHIVQYMRSDWIINTVDEFQSPKFRSENMLQFEVLLFLGLLITAKLLRDRRFFEGALILFWAQAALKSVRHVPLYAVAAAPLIAAELSALWKPWAVRTRSTSMPQVFLALDRDFSASSRRNSIWAVILPAIILACCGSWPSDFPRTVFPVEAVNRNATVVAPQGSHLPRILTTDQWGDYLIYRFYPTQRVFVDGRSDFYGPALGQDYVHLMTAQKDWEDVIGRYRFDVALLPVDWPLVQLLTRQGAWVVRYHDAVAVLLERRPNSGLMPAPVSAE